MQRRVVVILVGLGVAVAARPGAAQLQGLPVYFSPKGGTGLTVAGDFGWATSTKLGTISAPNPWTIGGRVALGLPFVTIGVGAAHYDPNVSTALTAVQYAGTAAVKLFGGGLLPVAVSVQAGAGYLRQGRGTFATKSVNIPIGLGVALSLPTPGASLEPWVAGRVQVSSVASGAASGTQFGYGVSGGLSVGMPIGLGLHVALDWVKFGAKPGSQVAAQRVSVERMTAGAGIHFSIKLPGLPGIPII